MAPIGRMIPDALMLCLNFDTYQSLRCSCHIKPLGMLRSIHRVGVTVAQLCAPSSVASSPHFVHAPLVFVPRWIFELPPHSLQRGSEPAAQPRTALAESLALLRAWQGPSAVKSEAAKSDSGGEGAEAASPSLSAGSGADVQALIDACDRVATTAAAADANAPDAPADNDPFHVAAAALTAAAEEAREGRSAGPFHGRLLAAMDVACRSGSGGRGWRCVAECLGRTGPGLRLLLDLADAAEADAGSRGEPRSTGEASGRGVVREAVTRACHADRLRFCVVSAGDVDDEMLDALWRTERVHAVARPGDLLNRMGPDGRLMVLVHPLLPRTPLAQLWGALTRGVPRSLAAVVEAASPSKAHANSQADTLTLYSVSNRRPSLGGMGLGQHIIKSALRVVGDAEGPRASTIATLSPMPRFHAWVKEVVDAHVGGAGSEGDASGAAWEGLHSHLWQQSRLTSEDQARFWAQLQRHVASLADQSSVPTSHVRVPRWAVVALLRMAHWHIAESGGQALRGGVGLSSLRDPVASFHLKNGALSHHVHWMADGSERGMRQSMGVMATYVYRGTVDLHLPDWEWQSMGEAEMD